MPSPITELLSRLGRAFDALGVRWYLFGAQAAVFHGVSRATADVDVTVRLGATTTSELLAALGAERIASRLPDDPDFVQRTRVVPVVDLDSTIPVDVMLAGSGLEEIVLASVETRNVEGVSVPVPRAEHLVVLKVLAGRPKDIEDVAALLAARGDELDVPTVESLLRELEEALGQSDLLPSFRVALARARRP